MADRDDVLDRLLRRHGRTYADELGISWRRAGASELFQLLVGALLMSARISSDIAVAASRALFAHGYTDARRMAAASWQDRVDALGEGGYVRYDESTSRYLGDTAEHLLERYDGDLRRLREDADRDPSRIRRLLQECKGIGETGANIFCREAQAVWAELRPFADRVALDAARTLELGSSPEELARLRGEDLSTLTAALVRARLAGDLDNVRTGRDAPPTDTELATMTRDELYERARAADVRGRSSMTRAQLADALRR